MENDWIQMTLNWQCILVPDGPSLAANIFIKHWNENQWRLYRDVKKRNININFSCTHFWAVVPMTLAPSPSIPQPMPRSERFINAHPININIINNNEIYNNSNHHHHNHNSRYIEFILTHDYVFRLDESHTAQHKKISPKNNDNYYSYYHDYAGKNIIMNH